MWCQHKIGTMPHGRQVYVDVELRERDGVERLSITGEIGHPNSLRTGNADTCGQCQDTIREALNNDTLKPAEGWTLQKIERLLDAWETSHLNDMVPGCEHQMAAGWDHRPIDPSKPLRAYGKHFPGQSGSSWNMAGWVRPDEHPDGLLTKPCPVCGYRYGTEWKTQPIPDYVRELVEPLSS
jgi:hypothetical protein